MIFHQVDADGDRNFAYFLADADDGRGAIIDPPPDPARYADLVSQHRVTLDYVIITHGHSDHCWGATPAKRTFGARVVAHSSMHLGLDVKVDDGDTLSVGSLTLRFLYTPGHTDDHICVVCEDNVVTGDVLFVGKVGGTDLGPGARKQWESLQRLMQLPDDMRVWPGHNYGTAPSSTIGHEKRTNPFILQPTFDAFVHLKANWLDYKRAHGIL